MATAESAAEKVQAEEDILVLMTAEPNHVVLNDPKNGVILACRAGEILIVFEGCDQSVKLNYENFSKEGKLDIISR